VDRKLNADVLPYITVGSVAADGAGHLTMHDREHVERVRQVAADLIAESETLDLSPFELTLLLIAVYLHDLGNVIGRAGHERNINQVLKAANSMPPVDTVEYAVAKRIAGVHGGAINGSKDTISTIAEREPVSGRIVRSRLLAAILRLATSLPTTSPAPTGYRWPQESCPANPRCSTLWQVAYTRNADGPNS
jgi:hypothetical protein